MQGGRHPGQWPPSSRPCHTSKTGQRAGTATMERDRMSRSIIDHMHIIEALEDRSTDLAERLVREHCWGLAKHINDYVDYLD